MASLVALAASACIDFGPHGPGEPASLAVISGDAQSATVASAISTPITIRVLDRKLRAVPNVSIQLAVTSADGQVSVPTAVSNDSGVVRVAWTLGSTAGAQTLTARVASDPNITAFIHATAMPDVAVSLKVLGVFAPTVRNAEPIDASMRVAVVDRFGNTAPGGGITIAASLAGSGRRELRGTTSAVTDASGVAAFPQLAIVGDTGTSSLVFQAASLTTALVSLRVVAGAAVRLDALPSTSAHGIVAQQGPALSVRATDLSGNPVAGTVVTFTFASISASTQLTTNADGVATFTQWTMPSRSGVYRATASAASVTDVVFDVTANAGPLASLTVLTDLDVSGGAGDDGPPIRVAAVDGLANAVVGATVTFSIAGGAKLGDVPTDSTGVARLTAWKLPSVPATYAIAATAGNNVTSPTVRLTVRIGPPARLVLLSPVSATVTSSASVVARVTDLGGNSVAAATVDWSVTAGTATVAPSTSAADASGIVRTTLTMGTAAGMVHVRGLISQTSLATDLSASVLPGPYCGLTPGYTDLSLPVNTLFTGTVRAVDCWDNPIPGIALTPRSGGIQYTLLPTGAMSPSSTVTDASGRASFAAVTAPQPGLQIWLIDAPGPGAWFRVRAAGSRGYITPWNGTPTSGATWKIGSPPINFGFIVTQANGLPAWNNLVTFTLAPGNGTFVGGSGGGVFLPTFWSGLTTMQEGLVSITWSPPAVAGTYTMTVQSSAPNDSGSPTVVTVRVIP